MPDFDDFDSCLEIDLLPRLIDLDSLLSEALLLDSIEDVKAKIREALYCVPHFDNSELDVLISFAYKD